MELLLILFEGIKMGTMLVGIAVPVVVAVFVGVFIFIKVVT